MYSLLIPTLAAQGPPILPIDLIEVIAVVMGSLIVLVPIAGWTARFALKPITEAVARMREGQNTSEELQLVEKRLALLEQQMANLETDVKQLDDKREFDRQLASGSEE